MISIGIVEDNNNDYELLNSYLAKYSEDKEKFVIKRFSCASEFYNAYKKDMFDLLFLDVELGDSNGVDIARKIREADDEVLLIFVTNLSSYVYNGYEVDAIDYILKPVRYESLALRMNKTLPKIKNKNKLGDFIVEYIGIIKKISLNELYYIEVSGHTLVYHLENETISVRDSLKRIESELIYKHFMRCNNYTLVNLDKVEKIDKQSIIIKGDSIPISRPKKKNFVDSYMDFLLKGDN